MPVTRYSEIFGLGHISHPDANDLRYLMAAQPDFPTEEARRAFIYYTIGPIMDQGKSSECVGYSSRAFLSAEPNPLAVTNPPTPRIIYDAAQARDGMALPHRGTTLRAAASVLQEQGFFANYLWARNVTDIRRHMMHGRGPILAGTPWYSGMFEPVNGVVRLRGTNEGGHAWFIFGYLAKSRMYRCQNSWGTKWGDRGRFWISEDNLARLLSEGGEALAPTENPVTPIPIAVAETIVRPSDIR